MKENETKENYYQLLGIRSGRFNTASIIRALKNSRRLLEGLIKTNNIILEELIEKRKSKSDKEMQEEQSDDEKKSDEGLQEKKSDNEEKQDEGVHQERSNDEKESNSEETREENSTDEVKRIRNIIARENRDMMWISEVIESASSNDFKGFDEFNQDVFIEILYSTKKDMFRHKAGNIKRTYEQQLSDAQDNNEEIARMQKDTKEKLEDLGENFLKITEAYKKLRDRRFRKEYNAELEEFDYMKTLNDEELRLYCSERFVKQVLGEDFNPDMSRLDSYTDSRRKKEYPPFGWRAHLYEKRQKLLSATVTDEKNSILNQDIEVYSYGGFEFRTLFNPRKFNPRTGKNGDFTYADSLNEIIGVTKTNADQTKSTNFLIIPSGELRRAGEEFLTRVYLSDYMIRNAVINNAHYLGSVHKDKLGNMTIGFNGVGEEDKIRACFYAQSNPGIVIPTISHNPKSINDVFRELENRLRKGFYDDDRKQDTRQNERNKGSGFTHGE